MEQNRDCAFIPMPLFSYSCASHPAYCRWLPIKNPITQTVWGHLKRYLWAGTLLLSFISGSNTGFAETVKLQHLSYWGSVLSVSASETSTHPTVEAWPGPLDSENSPVQVIILGFPQAEADLAQLQALGNQIMLDNREIKKFLVTTLDSSEEAGNQKTKSNGIQIVIELKTPSVEKVMPPVVSVSDNRQWNFELLPGRISGGVKPAFAAEQLFSREKQKMSAVTTNPDIESETWMNRVKRLEQELLSSQSREEELRFRLSGYEDTLRALDPTLDDPQAQESAVIQNLRSSLLKLAQQLKEAKAQTLEIRNAKKNEICP